MGKLTHITADIAQWTNSPEIGAFGIIDDFHAVVDGSRNLLQALHQARALIQEPNISSVSVLRNSDTTVQSHLTLCTSFNEKLFGSEVLGLSPEQKKYVARSGKEIRRASIAPASLGSVLVWPEKNRLAIKTPAGFSSSNTSHNELFDYTYQSHWMPWTNKIGEDFTCIMKQASLAFPEFLSWNLRKDGRVTAPGILHYDLGYKVKGTQIPETQRSYMDLPPKFLKTVLARPSFSPLPGDVAMLSSISSKRVPNLQSGTIVCKAPEGFYEDYTEKRLRGEKRGIHVFDQNSTPYQSCDGDLLIVRLDGWPKDANGQKREPGWHAATPFHMDGSLATGEKGERRSIRGRILAIACSENSYLAPSVYKYLETEPPELPEELYTQYLEI